jgi:transposase-like protein
VAQVAAEFEVTDQTISNWRRQDRIDKGEAPGLSRREHEELRLAKRRIRELESEVAILKRAKELLKDPPDPKGRTRPSK